MLPVMDDDDDDDANFPAHPHDIQDPDERISECLEFHLDITALLDIYKEDLKTNQPSGDGKNGQLPTSQEGPPDDIRAFFGHPLTAANSGEFVHEEDTHASAVALLHEYINLPALDRSGMKIGDKINSIYDIMREDDSEAKVKPEPEPEVVLADENEVDAAYLELIQSTLAGDMERVPTGDVDRYFFQDCGADSTAIIPGHRISTLANEEVIHEICVQTTDDGTADYIFSQINGVDDITDAMQKPEVTESAKMAVQCLPVIDIHNESGHPRAPIHVTADTRTAPLDNNRPRAINKVGQLCTNTKTKAGEHKHVPEEKSLEISKKLVKALTEKILKRRTLSQQQPPPQEAEVGGGADNHVHASATVNTPTTSSPMDVHGSSPMDVHGYIRDSMELTSKSSSFSAKHAAFLEELHGEAIEIPAETPVTSPLNIATSAPFTHPASIHTDTTTITVPSQQPPCSIHVQSVQAPPQSHVLNRSVSTPAETSSNFHHPLLQVPIHPCTQTPHTPTITSPAKLPTYPCASASNQNIDLNHINSAISCTNTRPVQVPEIIPSYFPAINNGYVYPTRSEAPPSSGPDRDMLLERYIQQQNAYFREQQHYPLPCPAAGGKETSYGMKSPDSGYGEVCVSPSDRNGLYKEAGLPVPTTEPAGEKAAERVCKRRRSAPTTYVKQYWNAQDKHNAFTIPKLEVDPTGYSYILETPISTTQRADEDRITYLNKGQYYQLTLDHSGDRHIKAQMVKSVIMVVFREDKHLGDERKAWDFWHSRQHSLKQRVIDIDTKNSSGVVPSCIEELAYNAVAVRWNPRDAPVKVNVAVHCLSTDFSNQKGVKGLAMHVQIDTYESTKDNCPVISRGYCQIKVFCDKGAERKARDEERRKQTRVKCDTQTSGKSKRRQEDVFHSAIERSEFYVMADLHTPTVLFSPLFENEDAARASTNTSPVNLVSNDEDCSSSITSSVDEAYFPAVKRSRTDSRSSNTGAHVLLYVREPHESVYTALMLRVPTLSGFLQAIEEKYNVPASKIKNTYKRSKKGILIRMDDNIIRHYSHEATFIIEFSYVTEDKDLEIVMSELDVISS